MNNRLMLIGFTTEMMMVAIIFSILLLLMGFGILISIHFWIIGRGYLRSITTIRHESCTKVAGLSPDDLKRLPCYDYIEGKKIGAAVDCAVCLESFHAGDRCRMLPVCKHNFHAQCVDSWLLKSSVCPLCRSIIAYQKDSMPLEEQTTGIGLESEETIQVFVDMPTTVAS